MSLTGLTAYQAITEELKAIPGKTLFIPGGSATGQNGSTYSKIVTGLKLLYPEVRELKDKFS
ncbi:hypothetical protein ACVQ92_09440 [Staphylococcus aureus]